MPRILLEEKPLRSWLKSRETLVPRKKLVDLIERKTLVLKEPLIKMFWSQHSLAISRGDLATISRYLEYFSDDLTRRIRRAEEERKAVWHPVLGVMGREEARGMVTKATEASNELRELIDMMTEAGVEEIKLE